MDASRPTKGMPEMKGIGDQLVVGADVSGKGQVVSGYGVLCLARR